MGLTLREGERGADVVLAIRGDWGGEKRAAVKRGGVRREREVIRLKANKKREKEIGERER